MYVIGILRIIMILHMANDTDSFMNRNVKYLQPPANMLQ